MLVVPDKKMLIIDSSHNESVRQFIPHAKELTHNDKSVVAVPFGPIEAMVLRNMGFSVPDPIKQYYSWPARFKPMDHQIDTSSFLTAHKRALCLNAPGTGKSISSLWAADFLLTEGVIKKIVIVAPLSTLKVVWGAEIRHHMPHRQFVICTGTKKKRIELLQQTGVQYVIINHDGFTNMRDYMTDVDLVIYDEATALKSPSSQRFKLFFKWVNTHHPWLWMLTGTPISQTPADAWTLARLVESPNVQRSFTAFKDVVMKKVTQFKWIPRENSLEICKKVLQPSIRFSLDECKDLPDTNFVGRKTDLSKQQQKAFKDMQDRAVTTFKDGQVTAANTAVMLSKLLQIACGVVYTEDSSIALDCAERYNTLTNLLNEIGDKAIIFVPLKGVQRFLLDKLRADKFTVELVNGDVSKKDRDEIFHNFQHTDEPKILLAHPKVAAHGLTLTASKDIVWYAPIYSLEQYEQANARIRRLSTEGKTTVWHIYATNFEAELYRRLRKKQSTLAEFLDLVRGINHDES